ncbi:bifunctional 4-hydroxy-3-methylbut-2-enyl diphosphate reductase/30S ribosomal protein S1 [Syntrophomonas zehnderi]|uniref:bifunctional 4-hydroxy-3-methylbut-2-enyl diphosphate reductase/30S ribosomal protein S1 n=1 Tax=Syntrophomonas zehnderi TaxID=404335 RepID=UPI001FA6C8E1|nr:bifunctional 4-hydroxy-3-methylbut-2-enyl diphosphate reductase/30S ribosomal protein S1 [Syntrophomonas zehnderi]
MILAEEAGFCAGVRRAFKIAENTVSDDLHWVTLGPLVHNQAVVDHFTAQGISPADDMEKLAADGIIIRSHGIAPQIIANLQEKGIIINDATCPLVKRVHETAALLTAQGYEIIIYGDYDHPEVQGILGWCNNNARVIASVDEALVMPVVSKMGVISQTTKNESDFYKLVAALVPKAKEIRAFNTICSATLKRLEAARILSRKVELMLVIGDKSSSNTKTLARECQISGVKTQLIESAGDLIPAWFKDIKRVGITAGASTPDWIIKEVLDRMTQFDDGAPQEQTQQGNLSNEESFAKLEAEMADIASPNRGDIIKGVVIEVRDDEVMVDVGGKSEGIIPLREMSVKEANSAKELAAVGEEIEVLVLKWDDDGTILLSKKKVDAKKAMDTLEEIYNSGGVVEGSVVSSVKGGLLVDVGVVAFLPASHVEDGFVKNLDEYVGQSFKFNIIEFNRHKKRGSQIVLSRKAMVEAEKSKLKEQFWASIEEGQTIKGRVKRIVDYGAFIDLGGFEGLLHVSEIDHVRIEHPSAVLTEGQEIDVFVLALDREKQRVSLSRKKLLKSPWEIVLEKYQEGDIIDGKVVRLASFGAFVEIEPGVDGLVHISQLANHRVEKPQDVVSVNQPVKVKILSIDSEEKRIGLSLKEVAADVEDQGVEEYLANQENEFNE